MIRLENYEVVGWEHAIRGMRNPMNSWKKSDSEFFIDNVGDDMYERHFRQAADIGDNDHNLMMKLAKGGSVHAKYRRMITVYVDITAPLYFFKEFDTYKVGTVANSCSTMHKIHEKEFTMEDFSCEHLLGYDSPYEDTFDLIPNIDDDLQLECCSTEFLKMNVGILNFYRERYLATKDKKYWWQMIQLLPSNYNQKRTVMLNYEVLAGIYESRRNHKLDEWREFCDWILSLPYSEIILGGAE